MPRAGTSVRLRCPKCEGRLDIPDEPTNDMVISCKACGTPFGTWAEVKRAMKAAAKKEKPGTGTGLKSLTAG